MKLMKRLCSILLVLSILCSVLPQVALPASAATYSGTCGADGDNLTWTLDTATGALTITGTGEMKNWVGTDALRPWEDYCNLITSVCIDSGVMSIGSYAFCEFTALTSITIPDTMVSIGSCAFWRCTVLTSVSIPCSMTSIGVGAFYGCTGLTSITIPDSVTSIGNGAFSDCTGLTNITIPVCVTSIGRRAFNLTGLTSIRILNPACEIYDDPATLGTAGTTTIYGFAGSTAQSYAEKNGYTFTEINVVLYNATNGVIIGHDVNEYDLGIGFTFDGDWCNISTQEATVTDATLRTSSTNAGLFRLEDNGNGTVCFINRNNGCCLTSDEENNTYYDCGGSNVAIEIIPTKDGYLLKRAADNYYYAIDGDDVLVKELIADDQSFVFRFATWYGETENEGNTIVCALSDATSASTESTEPTTAPTEPTEAPTEPTEAPTEPTPLCAHSSATLTGAVAATCAEAGYTGDYICDDCGETVTAGAEIAALGHDYVNGACTRCGEDDPSCIVSGICGANGDNLTWTLNTATGNMVISGTGAMTDYSYTYFCDKYYTTAPWGSYESDVNLVSVVISSGVTHIGECAFSGCEILHTITIPDSVTTIGGYALSDSPFTNIIVDEDNPYFRSIDGVLYNKDGTRLIRYPGGRSGTFAIPDGVMSIDDCAFRWSPWLKSIVIPDGVTSIGSGAFMFCYGMTGITISDSVTSIGSSAFFGCDGLTTLTIPNGVTSISYNTFADCFGLTSITIPDSVTSICSSAFSCCTGLTNVYYTGCESDWNKISIGNNNEDLTNATIHYVVCEHTNTLLTGAVAATCIEAGYTGDYICDDCGETVTAGTEIAALGHDYVNGVCARCGAEGPTTLYFEKVIAAPADWSGEYLLVYEGNAATAYVFNGLSTQNAYAEARITPYGIALADGMATLTIVPMDGGYSIQVNGSDNDGKYIGGTADANIMNFTEEEALNTVAMGQDGVVITSDTSVLRWNNNEGSGILFRYYKSVNYSNQQPIQLYKLPEHAHVWVAGTPVAATCTADGYIPFTCSVCGKTVNEPILATGHVDIAPEDGRCDRCGASLPIQTGDVIAIVLASTSKAVSTSAVTNSYGNHLQPVSITISNGLVGYQETIAFEVQKDSTGAYRFVAGGKYLTSGPTGDDQLSMETTATEYSSWLLEEADGGWYIKNKAARYGYELIPQYLEYFQTFFSIFGKQTSELWRFIFDFYPLVTTCTHDWVAGTPVAPTCTENGYTPYTCSRCANTKMDDIVPKSGHSFGEWIVDTPATILQEGTKHRTCTGCGETEKESIPCIEIDYATNTEYGLANFTVVNAQTLAPIENAQIFVSTENDGENTFFTDAQGKVSIPLPVGKQMISALAQGCKTRNLTVTVKAGVCDYPLIGLSDLDTYDVQYTATEMTYEEIVEAGIDVTAAENQHVYKYELELDFAAEIDIDSILAYFGDDGTCLGITTSGSNHNGGDSGGGESKPTLHYHVYDGTVFHSWCKFEDVTIGETVALTYVPWRSDTDKYRFDGWYKDSNFTQRINTVYIEKQYTQVYGRWIYIGPEQEEPPHVPCVSIPAGEEVITVYPVSEHFWLIVRGEVKWLKEMFDIEMLILNNSRSDTLTNLVAELELPEGLSLATMTGEEQTRIQTVGTIPEAQQENGNIIVSSAAVHWYVRGDTAGSYSPTAHLTGLIQPFGEEISDTYKLQKPIEILAGNALHLDFSFPNAAYYGENYPITIALKNVSDKPVYNISHMVQIEEGMEVFYSDGTNKRRIEKSTWESVGVAQLNPGDSIVIEADVNIIFDSEIMQRMLDNLTGLVDGIENLMHAVDAVTTGIKAFNGLIDCISNCSTALDSLDLSGTDSTGKLEVTRQLRKELSGFTLSYMTTGDRVLDATIKAENSTVLASLKWITEDPEQWFPNSTYNDIKGLLDKVKALGNAVKNRTTPSEKFNIYDSIRTLISAIPIRYALRGVVMKEDVNNTTSIPWSYTTTQAGPQYFGITSLSKYLMSVAKLAFNDELNNIPFYPLLNSAMDDPMNMDEALHYVNATINEVEQFKAKDATGAITFRAWIERSSAPAKNGTAADDFLLSCDSEDATYDDGVLTFSGDGMISVTPLTDNGGTLVVEDSEGNTHRYAINVVEAHICTAGAQEVILPPTQEHDGFAVRRCETCKDVMEIVLLSKDGICQQHSFSEAVTIEETTCTVGGMVERTCTTCGYTEITFIEALGHNMVDGVCTRCGLTGGTCGDNLTWELNVDTGTLTISGTGAMTDYACGAPWEAYNNEIKEIVVCDGCTSVGDLAFQNCVNLTEVSLADSVERIGVSCFWNCTALQSIDLPQNLTTICGQAFALCSALETIAVPNSATSIGYGAFYGCAELTSVAIPDSVTSIGNNAFSNTAYYDNAANWTDDVLYIGNHLIKAKTSLSGDYSIREGTKTIADYAFYGCTGLTNVTIPNSVKSIGYDSFNACTGLATVTIPDSVMSIGPCAFKSCSGLTTLVIGDGVTSIGNSAFCGCSNLKSVTISGMVTRIGINAFAGCYRLTEVHTTDLAAWCQIGFASEDANPLNYAHNLYLNDTLVRDLIIPDGVTSIGNYAFHYCTGLTSVTIPDSVTSIGICAFRCCTGLTSVTIPDSVTSIGNGAFRSCQGLTTVTIGNCVTSIGNYAFSNCTGLTSITIPDNVTSIGTYVFSDCTGLTNVTIPNSVASISGYAFQYCTGLTSVTIPDSVTSIDYGVFYGCTGLTSVTIPDSVTSIGGYAFLGCTGLTSVSIPDSVTSIGYRAFYSCTGLMSVTIGNGVTSISQNAFSYCSGLNSVTIPDSVASIGYGAFIYCSNLTDVYYTGTESEWDEIAISDGNGCLTNATIHYNYCEHNWVTPDSGDAEHYCAPTCEADGLYFEYCSRCGATGEVHVLAALGHDFINHEAQAATCTAIGWNAYQTCSRCDYTTYAEIPALGHDFVDHAAQAATCTEIGWDAYQTCSRCDYTTYAEQAALGHVCEIIPEIAPTCTTPGYGSGSYCSRCGVTLVEQTENIAPLGHDLVFLPQIAPTCTDSGISGGCMCTRCGTVFVEQIVNAYALGHDLHYVNNGSDHSIVCSRCDYNFTEAHDFTSGTCVCGAVESAPGIKSASLVLDEDIDVSFTVELPAGGTDPCLVVNGTTITAYTEVDGALRFIYTGITPQCMGDSITAVLHAEVNGEEYSDTVADYSVRQYCVNMLDNTEDDALKTLLSDLLIYGAAAQTYTGYRTDSLVTDGLDLTPTSFSAVSGKTASFEGAADAATDWISAGLLLGNTVTMRFAFFAESVDGLTVNVSINGREEVFDADDFIADGAGKYYVDFAGIEANEFDDAVTATFCRGGKTVGRMVSYTVNAYVASTQNSSDANLRALVRALYNYGASAAAYSAAE